MAKIDKFGVRHSGWADVQEANERGGHAGVADREYEKKAKAQGIDLSLTRYRKSGGYNYSRVKLED